MKTQEFIESLTRLGSGLDDIRFGIKKIETLCSAYEQSLTNQPSDPEATRYEVGKEYEVSDDAKGWLRRTYVGYIENQHWFREDIETLACYIDIREIAPKPDPRIGKVCVFWDDGEATNLDVPKSVDRLESIKAANRFETGRHYSYANCMLLTDFIKLIEQ